MDQIPLLLENLDKLDMGKIAAAFRNEVQHVTKDCMDRPLDDRARKVVLTFSVVPFIDTSSIGNHCDKVDVDCEISSSIPKRKTTVYSMTTKQDGNLVFRPDDPGDPEANKLWDSDVVDRNTGEVTTKR